ncbi:MAG: hypothetical protein H7210_12930 [Pyrinomonadaceae bacterium]|nr:hypothetical protein [Phycisphaerales bacterium]
MFDVIDQSQTEDPKNATCTGGTIRLRQPKEFIGALATVMFDGALIGGRGERTGSA